MPYMKQYDPKLWYKTCIENTGKTYIKLLTVDFFERLNNGRFFFFFSAFYRRCFYKWKKKKGALTSKGLLILREELTSAPQIACKALILSRK